VVQCFYSTAQTLISDISISTKMDMYHYKIDTTLCQTSRRNIYVVSSNFSLLGKEGWNDKIFFLGFSGTKPVHSLFVVRVGLHLPLMI